MFTIIRYVGFGANCSGTSDFNLIILSLSSNKTKDFWDFAASGLLAVAIYITITVTCSTFRFPVMSNSPINKGMTTLLRPIRCCPD